MGKANNEYLFSCIRARKTTVHKLKQLNLNDMQAKNKNVYEYETLEALLDLEIKRRERKKKI